MASRHPSLEAYLSLSTGAARLPPPCPVAYVHQEKRGNKVGVAFLQEGIDTRQKQWLTGRRNQLCGSLGCHSREWQWAVMALMDPGYFLALSPVPEVSLG